MILSDVKKFIFNQIVVLELGNDFANKVINVHFPHWMKYLNCKRPSQKVKGMLKVNISPSIRLHMQAPALQQFSF